MRSIPSFLAGAFGDLFTSNFSCFNHVSSWSRSDKTIRHLKVTVNSGIMPCHQGATKGLSETVPDEKLFLQLDPITNKKKNLKNVFAFLLVDLRQKQSHALAFTDAEKNKLNISLTITGTPTAVLMVLSAHQREILKAQIPASTGRKTSMFVINYQPLLTLNRAVYTFFFILF